MRFKRVPLRSPGGEDDIVIKTEEVEVEAHTFEEMSESARITSGSSSSERELETTKGHQATTGGRRSSSSNYAHQQQRARSLHHHPHTTDSFSKDEETEMAQAKLRHYESLGLIKVEVDEPSEETYQLLASEDMQQCFVQQQQQQQLQLPPEADSLPPTSYQHNHQGEVVVPVYRSPSQQPPMVLAQQQQQSIASMKGGMVEIPNLNDALGEFDFTVTVEEKERTTKSPMWLMSSITNKLYTNMNKAVPFEIHLKKKLPAGKFFVRAAAVFSSAQFLRSNVTRCPNHASISDVTNHDFPYPNHVIRADHPEAKYEESSTGRLSVVVPLDILVDGSDYTPILLRFMCLGSCVGGINRRPISILLTLEDGAGHPCGRKVIDVRVCACPTRDIRTDEQTLLNKGKKRRGNSMPDKPTAPIRKKPKMIDPKVEPQDDDDTLLYLPVRGRKLYDFLKATKETYLKMHPEYAAKYPDDLGLMDV